MSQSELFHLVLHVSTVFMGAQLALLAYNSVLLRTSIFAITVNAKYFVTSSSQFEFSWTSIRRCVLEDLSKLSAVFAQALSLLRNASLVSSAILCEQPAFSSYLSPLRPVCMVHLRLSFGKADISVTLIYFSRPPIGKIKLSLSSPRQQ